jgi:hypothetical protein
LFHLIDNVLDDTVRVAHRSTDPGGSDTALHRRDFAAYRRQLDRHLMEQAHDLWESDTNFDDGLDGVGVLDPGLFGSEDLLTNRHELTHRVQRSA